MYPEKTFVLFGRDKRQFEIAKALVGRGHKVRLCLSGSLDSIINGCEVFLDWRQALTGADVVILPLPITRDGSTLAYSDEAVSLERIINCAIKSGCRHIIGGIIPESLQAQFDSKILFDDYYKCEDLQKKNALPSAEGALMIAMENTDITVRGMRALICGYGRIGKSLAEILYSLGADVTVAARRDESLCEAALKGYKAMRIEAGGFDNTSIFKEHDVIFNTVPSQIFSKNCFSSGDKNALYIEIASAPYGLNITYAREAGVHVIFAPSIPSKYAPSTAGRYIFETISEILAKRGVEI